MTNAERCAACGVNLAMVGRAHRCVPVSRGGVEGHAGTTAVFIETKRQGPRIQQRTGTTRTQPTAAGVEPGPREPSSYRYRDADEWRAYMRGYMRRYRARKNSSGAAADGG